MNTELPTGHELEGSSSAGRHNETTKTILTNTENQTGDVKTTTTVTTSSPSTVPSSKIIEKQAQKRIFKIIVIGDSNVGKTCLTYRFCSGKFPDKTEATIGVDFREKMILVEGEQIKVSFFFSLTISIFFLQLLTHK